MTDKLITFLTIEEVRKLLKAEKKKDYKIAIILGFGSGLRISEIVGQKRKDGTVIPALTEDKVNLDKHQIRVEQGKGKKDRITVTSPWLNQTNIKLLALKIPVRTLQYNFSKLCQKVLGSPHNLHMLRHGFGNYMVNEKRVPAPVVQQLMGHASIKTTGIYTRANPTQAIASAWEAFN